MAMQVTPKYPDAQAIERYHLGHPIFKTEIDTVEKTTLYAPGIIKQLAARFGGKAVPEENVDGMIFSAIRAAATATQVEDKIKLFDLWAGVKKFTEETKDNSLSSELQYDNKGIQHLEATVALCRSFLKDALEGASYQPPKPGTTNWIRIVPKD